MICAACSHQNRDRARFCEECGARLEAAAARDAPAPPRPAPAVRAPVEGERKQLTVLFADVKGSLDLAARIDPEEWHGIVDRFFQIMTQGVHRFEGSVNQYIGDGVMALFGAPAAQEDHAQRACYAALHLQQQLRRFGNELRMSRGYDFSVRMGLNSGEVVVGTIGDAVRTDYTAQGSTVGLAARMEQLAEPGRIYVPGHLAKQVAGYFTFDEIGAFDVKGVTEPVRVLELTGLGPLRTRFERSRARGLTRFVGRTDELALLEAAFADVRRGRGRVVAVVAEPGVGKSRLCWEFAERCRARGVPVREAHGVSHGRFLPLLPIVELLRGYFDVTEHDTPRVARNKIAGALLLLDRDLEPTLPVVFELLGIADPERAAPAPSLERRQRHLLDVARRVIRGAQTPSVILVEDLHWIDPGTEAFLAATVEACLDTPTLLLVNYRPEYAAPWLVRPYCTQTTLAPLTDAAQAELIGELVGDDPSLGTLPRRLQERTRGNPFFLEEVVQSLIDRGLLVGRRGRYELVDPQAPIEIPATIQAVLAARIDRLGEVDKHVLQSASVLGKRVSAPVLRQVAEVDAPSVEEALGRLVAGEFLDLEALLPEAEYVFRHPLTREVAYASQLAERRTRRHRRAAGALLRANPGREEELAALIAHHWEQAGELAHGARWYRRAAERAGLGHAAESLAHWAKVRELVTSAPRTTEMEALGATACAQLFVVGARAGRPADDMDALFAEGSARAQRCGDVVARVRLLAAYGLYTLLARADFEAALPHVDEAVALADAHGDRATRLMAGVMRGQVLTWGGAFEAGLESAERTAPICGADWELATDLVGYSPRFALLFYQTLACAYTGRLVEAHGRVDGLFAWVLAGDDRFLQSAAFVLAAHLAVLEGDAGTALAHARRTLDLSEQMGIAGPRVLAHRELGRALLASDRPEQALEVLERGQRLLAEVDAYRVVAPQMLAHLAEARAALGDAVGARADSAAGVAAAVRAGAYLAVETALARAHVLLGCDGEAAAAEVTALVADAAAAAARGGARLYEPMVAEARARLAHALGDAPGCEAALAEARRLLRALGLERRAARLGRWRGARVVR